MSKAMIDVQTDSANRCRDMFDIILEKDIKIEELEQAQEMSNSNLQGYESSCFTYFKLKFIETNLKLSFMILKCS